MRKTLALVLSAVMVLSLALVGVSAEDLKLAIAAAPATEIKTAAEFAAMAADGNYKLAADITIDASYEAAFTGTFDGNGHTVTVSKPMFAEFAGSVKNLTTKGAIDNTAAAAFTGAVAATVKGNASFEKITNEATINGYLTDFDSTYRAGAGGIAGTVLSGVVTFTDCTNKADVTGHAVGGILGSYDDGESTYDATKYAVTFTNCKNTGHINASLSTKTTCAASAGGIVGIVNKVAVSTFTDCSNTGKVEADAACAGPAGGICGYIYTNFKTDDAGVATFTGCTNSGEVISADSQIGGICGWSRLHSLYTDCVNSGYIHSGTNASGVCSGYAAGIACRANADKAATSSTFVNCLNTGNVESGRDQCGGILAYNNAGDLTFINCTNTGRIAYVATPKEDNQIQCAGIMANHGTNGDTMSGVMTFKKCVNKGEIVSKTKNATTTVNAGGIIAYVYGTSKQYAVIEDCVNYGTVYGSFAGQFMGYTNTAMTTITNCYGAGKVAECENSPGFYGCVFGCSSVGVKDTTYSVACPITGVYLVENDGTEYYSYATAAANAGNRRFLTKEYTDETITNPAYSTSNPGVVTVLTAAELQTKIAALGEVGYVAPAAPVDPTPSTGDNAVWFAVIGAVALLGTAVIVRKVNA